MAALKDSDSGVGMAEVFRMANVWDATEKRVKARTHATIRRMAAMRSSKTDRASGGAKRTPKTMPILGGGFRRGKGAFRVGGSIRM